MFHACCSTDISLFDELDYMGDAEDLLQALEHGSYVSSSSSQYANVFSQPETQIIVVINRRGRATAAGAYIVKHVRKCDTGTTACFTL